jgi:hypothetical protein
MSGVMVNGLFNEDALFGAVHTAGDFLQLSCRRQLIQEKQQWYFVIKEEIFL